MSLRLVVTADVVSRWTAEGEGEHVVVEDSCRAIHASIGDVLGALVLACVRGGVHHACTANVLLTESY